MDTWQWLETFLIVTAGGATDIWWVEASDAAKHPIVHGMPSHTLTQNKTKHFPALNHHSALEKPYLYLQIIE